MTILPVKSSLHLNECPTMTSLEMVEYINEIAEKADKAKTAEEINKCIVLTENVRNAIPIKYHYLCKALHCHINSLYFNKIYDKNNSENESGVYLIEFEDRSVKIGMTQTSFTKRLNTIKNQNSSNILRYAFIKCDNPSKLESDLHAKFSNTRGNGEFFFIDFANCLDVAKKWAGKNSIKR